LPQHGLLTGSHHVRSWPRPAAGRTVARHRRGGSGGWWTRGVVRPRDQSVTCRCADGLRETPALGCCAVLSLPKTQSGVGRRGPPMGRGTGVSVGEAKVCRWRGLGHARPEVAALAGTVRCRGTARRLNRNSGHARPSDPLHSGRWACASGGASILMMKTADVRKSNDLTAVG